MLGIFEQPVLKERLQILETARSIHGHATRRIEPRPGRRNGDCEVLGDALGKFGRDIELLERRIVASL
jgi:hypothetical protein